MFLSPFGILSRCISNGFRCLIWHQRNHLLSLFLILITPFIDFFNLWGNSVYVLLDNWLKRSINIFFIYGLNYPTRFFNNPIIYSIQSFLKRFFKHIFIRINHCFGCRIKINKRKFYVSIFFVFCLAKRSLLFDI